MIQTVAVVILVLVAVAVLGVLVWPPGQAVPAHIGNLAGVQITVGGAGTNGFAMIVFADEWVALVPIKQLQSRSWMIGGRYTLVVQQRLWPRGPRYWLVQDNNPQAQAPAPVPIQAAPVIQAPKATQPPTASQARAPKPSPAEE